MSNLTWSDDPHSLIGPEGHAGHEYAKGATSVFKTKESEQAYWRITPIRQDMARASVSDFTRIRVMWYVEFVSNRRYQWTAMEYGYNYEQEWSNMEFIHCLNTNRLLFYTLDQAKKFCEQTYGFSCVVHTKRWD